MHLQAHDLLDLPDVVRPPADAPPADLLCGDVLRFRIDSIHMFNIDRVTTHPGRILVKDFLEPLQMSQTTLAARLGISLQRVNEIC